MKLASGRLAVATPRFTSATDALGYAVNHFRPPAKQKRPDSNGVWDRRDEPNWVDPNTLLTLSRDLKCSNESAISVALSTGTTTFSDLPTFRNFFAHRNQDTAEKVAVKAAALLIPPSLRPVEALLFRPPSRSMPLISVWLAEIRLTITALCA
jgi:hypothetical protein